MPANARQATVPAQNPCRLFHSSLPPLAPLMIRSKYVRVVRAVSLRLCDFNFNLELSPLAASDPARSSLLPPARKKFARLNPDQYRGFKSITSLLHSRSSLWIILVARRFQPAFLAPAFCHRAFRSAY